MNKDSLLIFEAYKLVNEQEVKPQTNMPETDMEDPRNEEVVSIAREILQALQAVNINDPHLAYCIVGIQKAKQLAGRLLEMHTAASALANKAVDDTGDASEGTSAPGNGENDTIKPTDGPSSYTA